MNIETILQFKEDLDNYKLYDLRIIGRFYDISSIKQDDLKWLIAIKHTKDNMFATMNPGDISLHSEDELNNNFKFGKLIGRGSGGDVFSAIDVNTKEIVAIKICKDEPEQCKQELYFGTKLNHPNIINVKEGYNITVHITAGTKVVPAIIMENCVSDLYRKTKQLQNPMTEGDAAKVVKAITTALGYLANQNIIHRDVKLDNILLCGPNGDIPKLADFGLATDYNPTEKLILPIGTLKYRPPEMFSNEKYDASIDIRALGIVMYELLTGINPYDPDDKLSDDELSTAIKQNHRLGDTKNEYKKLSDTAKNLIDDILGENMVNIKPSERPTANDILNHSWITVPHPPVQLDW